MQRLKNIGISILILTLLVLPSTTSSHNQERAPVFSPLTTSRPVEPQRSPTKFVKANKPILNRYIVVLDEDVVPDNVPIEVRRERIAALANSQAQFHGGAVDFIYETALKGYAIELPNEAAARVISNSPRVKWVEEDGYGEWAQAPPNPQPSPPWGLDSLDSGIPAPAPDANGRTNGSYGWFSDGSGVSAYILDSGINTGHPEFMTPFFSRASIAANCFQFVNCVSGTQTPFFNQQTCASGLPSSSNNDCWGHGTHVAGTIGGNTYGVAKNVNLRSVKVGSTFGPVISAVIAGVNWVTGNHQGSSSTPAVANMSLEVSTGAGVESAVQNAINQGVTVVAAAGNGNTNANSVSPANVAAALTVGAVDWNGFRSPVSNWGPLVDLFAPGVQIASAASGGGICTVGTFCLLSGTSHAAPHVSGAVAMYLRGRPGQVNCNVNPIQGVAPTSGNLSTCPDRVTRYILANARRDVLNSNINGTLPSPNRFLSTTSLSGPANPIDNSPFFVWTQYTDFLNREPDHPGLNFWINEIASCGSDAQCVEVKRINVSAAFFLSIEFQETGYLAYRFYNAALNRSNGLPRFLELMADSQTVGNGVVVGAPGWEAQLEANKVAYANQFVSRSEFTALYPTSLSATQFVDALYAHAGITPSAQERQAAIDEFNNPSGARGRVLRRVADNQDLKNRETNRAFVLMEYFGYLRRNPDDPPDNNLDGYNFWLNKLNQFNGNFVDAEMVKAFITSAEYRRRFGP